MVQITSVFLGLVFALPPLVSAAPFNFPRDIPSGASRLALDEKKGTVIAYDASGKSLGTFPIPKGNSTAPPAKRDGTGSCTELSLDDAKKLTGWSKLEDAAKANWGSGHYNIALNPDDYKAQPATVCISSDTAMVTMDGTPKCSTQSQSTGGQLVGSSGSTALASTQGEHLTQTTSVTLEEASVAVGMSISAKVGIPEVAEVTSTLSTDITISNSLTKSFASTADTMQTQTVTMNAPEGKTCHLDYTSKSCDYSGTGSIRFYATGWVWFNYDSKTHDHYKWALSIDQTLPNIDDRSSMMNFAASGNIQTKSEYKGTCV